MIPMPMELILQSADVNLPQSIANLEALKAELIPRLEKYNNLVVTEDSIKAAKSDRAALNKLKSAIDEQRKSIKKLYLEPYEALEAQCKEVVRLIDAPIQAIDKQIKAFDAIEEEQKYKALTEYFASLNPPEWVTITDVLNPKWRNKTAKLEALQSEMQMKLQGLMVDLGKLSAMYADFPHLIAITDRFKQEKDFSKVAIYAITLKHEWEKEQRRLAEEEKASQNQAETTNAPESVSNALVSDSNESSINIPVENQNGITSDSGKPESISAPNERILKGKFWVECTRDQLIALREYMKSQNIKFGAVKE